jgi:hypothetical protein
MSILIERARSEFFSPIPGEKDSGLLSNNKNTMCAENRSVKNMSC